MALAIFAERRIARTEAGRAIHAVYRSRWIRGVRPGQRDGVLLSLRSQRTGQNE